MLHNFCRKFHKFSSSKRILKIGLRLDDRHKRVRGQVQLSLSELPANIHLSQAVSTFKQLFKTHSCGSQPILPDAKLHGIGKGTVINKLKQGHTFKHLGDLHASLDEVMADATKFIGACYGSKETDDLSRIRVDLWSKKWERRTSQPLHL